MATKLKKTDFTKAFAKTKLAYLLDREIGKGEFLWQYDYKPKLEDNAWHPSSHCVQTPHELYHYAKNAPIVPELHEYPKLIKPRDIEPSLSKVFQVGHFWHQYLQEICVRGGFCDERAIERKGEKSWWTGEKDPHSTVADSLKHKPFHWVTGSGDVAPIHIPGHGDYLLDFKTMGSHTFRPTLPHELTLQKWECQVNVYMDFFDLEKAMILGINKDAPHDFKEFEFYRNEALIDALYYKWRLVSECLDNDIEPPEDEVVDLPLQGVVNV